MSAKIAQHITAKIVEFPSLLRFVQEAAVRGLAAASKRSFDPKLLSPGERNSAAGMTVALMVVKPRVSIVTHTRK
jgi:hypothetical protein